MEDNRGGLEQRIAVLEGRVRRQRRVTAGLGVVLVLSAATVAFAFPSDQRFTEIDVERINVVEPNGDLALVISNSQKLPGVFFRGEEISDREGTAGMLFFSDGFEVGGLTYSTTVGDEGVSASRHLSFDQHRSDQVLVLNHSENPNGRATGIRIVDRSPDVTMDQVIERQLQAARGTEQEQAEARQWLQENYSYGQGWSNRVVLASVDGQALFSMNDEQARPRIQMSVDGAGVARLEFLDEEGNVVLRLPE